jgi:hypothetical protein
MAASPIVVITGPPGAGKTTVARLVADRFEKAVCLETDWFWTTFVKGFIPPWLPEADSQNRVVVRAFAAAASALAMGGYAVVLEGIVGPWNLDILRDVCEVPRTDLHYFILRPALDVSLRRATAREGRSVFRDIPHSPTAMSSSTCGSSSPRSPSSRSMSSTTAHSVRSAQLR